MALNRTEKQAMDIISDAYKKIKASNVEIAYPDMPPHIQLMLEGISKSLKNAGLIAESHIYMSGWDLYLTPDGTEYCQRLDSFRRRPNALSKEGEYLLDVLINANDPIEVAQYQFENISYDQETTLRWTFKELEDHQFILTQWGGDIPNELAITKSGHDYMQNRRDFVEIGEYINKEEKPILVSDDLDSDDKSNEPCNLFFYDNKSEIVD